MLQAWHLKGFACMVTPLFYLGHPCDHLVHEWGISVTLSKQSGHDMFAGDLLRKLQVWPKYLPDVPEVASKYSFSIHTILAALWNILIILSVATLILFWIPSFHYFGGGWEWVMTFQGVLMQTFHSSCPTGFSETSNYDTCKQISPKMVFLKYLSNALLNLLILLL